MPKNKPSSPEMIPYFIMVEGSVKATKAPQLMEFLSKISTEQTVTYRIGEVETPGIPIYEADVVSKHDPAVVKRAWDRLTTASVTGQNFPLQWKYDDIKKAVYLEGNPEAAIEWLKDDRRGERFNAGSITLLQRFLDPEFDVETYRPPGSSLDNLA